jgi:hypothetical protein
MANIKSGGLVSEQGYLTEQTAQDYRYMFCNEHTIFFEDRDTKEYYLVPRL